MNFGQLRAAIKADAHRPSMSDDDVKRFVEEGEGIIRRTLLAYPLSYVLTDSDRADVTKGVYSMPSGLSLIRAIYNSDGIALNRVAMASIDINASSSLISVYTDMGSRIRIFGIPPEDYELELEYLGVPAPLVEDEDTNDLLEEHVSIYKEAANVWLYKHTRDFELADDSQGKVTAMIESLNEKYGRQTGGLSQSGPNDFYTESTY